MCFGDAAQVGCKSLKFNYRLLIGQCDCSMKIDERTLEYVNKFVYLGRVIDKTVKLEKDLVNCVVQ